MIIHIEMGNMFMMPGKVFYSRDALLIIALVFGLIFIPDSNSFWSPQFVFLSFCAALAGIFFAKGIVINNRYEFLIRVMSVLVFVGMAILAKYIGASFH